MSYKRSFLVPDYYKSFVCKCGDCRSTCCDGWGIAIGMEEYFRLVGIECSQTLRSRLDTAFHLAEDRSPEHYAMVTPRFDGGCRLQGEDGLCMLQRECGEGAIPTVCRYYPRAPRLSPFPECCTSGSCEKTLELLFADASPLEFVSTELSFELPEPPASQLPADVYISTRLEAFALLGDRSRSFEERVIELSRRLYDRDGILQPNVPSLEVAALVLSFLEKLAASSRTIEAMLPEIREYFSKNQDTSCLAENIPELEAKLEKLFINHLFYKSFPSSFKSPREHFAEEAMALAMAVAVTKAAAAAHLSAAPSETAFVDSVAQIFRVIEHSRFDESAVRFLRGEKAYSLELLERLIRL